MSSLMQKAVRVQVFILPKKSQTCACLKSDKLIKQLESVGFCNENRTSISQLSIRLDTPGLALTHMIHYPSWITVWSSLHTMDSGSTANLRWEYALDETPVHDTALCSDTSTHPFTQGTIYQSQCHVFQTVRVKQFNSIQFNSIQ